jgi:hypothetical protein
MIILSLSASRSSSLMRILNIAHGRFYALWRLRARAWG